MLYFFHNAPVLPGKGSDSYCYLPKTLMQAEAMRIIQQEPDEQRFAQGRFSESATLMGTSPPAPMGWRSLLCRITAASLLLWHVVQHARPGKSVL